MTPRFRLATLGQLRLEGVRGEDLLRGRRKELVLLVFLARSAPRVVTREEMADLLWGERESSRARESLRQVLLRLRRALGDAINVTPESARVDPSLVELDATAFEREAAEGRLADVVERWHGDFLVGMEGAGGESFRAWVETERESLRRRLAAVLEALVTGALGRRQWDEAVAWGRRWTAVRPFDEPAHRELIEALRSDGRVEEALACHASFVARLRDELDAEPSPPFMALATDLSRAMQTARSPGPGSAALLTPDMVGREAVLGALIASWRDVRAGRAVALLVTGDEGLGKTRLCQEFARWVRADTADACVLVARAFDAEREIPWSTARQLLARLADAPGVLGAAASALRTVAHVVPAMRAAAPNVMGEDGPLLEAEPARIRAAIVEVVEAVAAEAPVLLVLDDSPAADQNTQQLIAALLERPLASVMLVMTAAHHALDGTSRWNELWQHRSLRRLHLQPLGAVEAEALIGSMVALDPEDRRRLAETLYAESEGNPFHIAELVFALADDGMLSLGRDGRWRVDPALSERRLPLPSGVREAVRRRLATLTDDERLCIAAAAANGRGIDLAAMERATELAPDRLAAAVNALLARRLLREISAGRGDATSFEFSHDMVRRVARELAAARVIPSSRPWRRPALIAAVAAVAAAALVPALILTKGTAASTVRPTIAIVSIDVATSDTATEWLADGLPQMIAAKLSRSTDLDVIPAAQARAVRRRAGHDMPLTTAQGLDIARRLGATIAVTGELARTHDDALVLDIAVHDAVTGRLLRSDALIQREILALADEAAARVLGAVDAATDEVRLAELETSSVAAYQHFVRAVELGSEGHSTEALRELDAAIALDSGFVAAVQSRMIGAMSINDHEVANRLKEALARFGARATAFDRLLWAANEAVWKGDIERSEAFARDLVRRYPRDPRAHAVLIGTYFAYGHWEQGEAAVQAALALDSLGIAAGRGPCASCLGYASLTQVRLVRGDWSGAEQAARRWVALQPELPGAWLRLAVTLAYLGRHDEAIPAIDRAVALSGSDPSVLDHLPRLLIMARRVDGADSLATEWASAPQHSLRQTALDLRVMIARERGQLRAANRAIDVAIAADPAMAFLDLVRGNTLSRLGEYAAANHLHERRIHGPGMRPTVPWPPAPGTARAYCWEHALLADAIAPGRDTLRLLAIADSLERGCSRSYYARDWTLHHHVRGLVHALAGRHAEAERAFRRVPHVVAEAWSRTAVELAKAQLALGRPRDAAATIRVAYATPVDAMGRYVPRSELDYYMALALSAAGMPDSAARYAAHVRRAWRDADPEVKRLLVALP